MRKNGFTLVEISIVLVIIALLVGGVIVGRSLIRSAELQSVISDFNQYTEAVRLFKEKYRQFPGDMDNATTFWGTDPAGCPGTYTAQPHIATCNGDANGQIGKMTLTFNVTDEHEWFRAWQQMANAGLIKGQYTGISGTGSARNSVIGVNVPAAKIANSGHTIYYYCMPQGNPGVWWPAPCQHIIVYGAVMTNYQTAAEILYPSEALAIDQKMDDGKPGFGNIRVNPSGAYVPNCTTSDVQATSQYNVSYNQIACNMVYLTGL